MELAARSLTCRRAGRIVFRDLSFDVPGGRAVAVRGPNGVGKSTLLRLLAGFLPAEAGEVALDGLALPGDARDWGEKVLYAGHLDAVKPALGVAENLAFWAGIHGAQETRIGAALERFGLARIAARPAAECSAGQKRRLGLARLLVADRPLWLLDEPTVSLDAESAALVAALVTEHVAGGGIALVATHIDLAVPGLGTLALSPPEEAAGPAAGADPFLEGAW